MQLLTQIMYPGFISHIISCNSSDALLAIWNQCFWLRLGQEIRMKKIGLDKPDVTAVFRRTYTDRVMDDPFDRFYRQVRRRSHWGE